MMTIAEVLLTAMNTQKVMLVNLMVAKYRKAVLNGELEYK